MTITNHERVGKALGLLRQGATQKGLRYNGLVIGWNKAGRLAVERAKETLVQEG